MSQINDLAHPKKPKNAQNQKDSHTLRMTLEFVDRAYAAASIPIMVGLERALGGDPDIGRLFLVQPRELHADLGEVQPRHLLVELLGQRVDLLLVFALIGPQ